MSVCKSFDCKISYVSSITLLLSEEFIMDIIFINTIYYLNNY
jgi:hypothetical protein